MSVARSLIPGNCLAVDKIMEFISMRHTESRGAAGELVLVCVVLSAITCHIKNG